MHERNVRKKVHVKLVNEEGFIEEPGQFYTCETKDKIWDLKKRIGRREHFNPEDLKIKFNDEQSEDLTNETSVNDLIDHGQFLARIPETEVQRDRLNVTHAIPSIEKLIIFTGPASNYKSFLLPRSQKCSLELHLGSFPMISEFGGKRKIALVDEFDTRRQMYRTMQYFVKSAWTIQIQLEVKGTVKRLRLNKVEKNGDMTELEGIMKNYYVSKAIQNPNVTHQTMQSILNHQSN